MELQCFLNTYSGAIMGLAERRFNKNRAKERSRSKLKANGVDDPTPRQIGKGASTHSSDCSCMLCGNPRKHFKGKSKNELTLSERKANDREQSAFGSIVDGAIESLTSLPSWSIHLPELDFEFPIHEMPDIDFPDIDLDF
jgi:hypothetical protein